ncbi:MAG: 4Fe-4S dicluster domain-containing protein [Thermoplasmata archaeon]|nr:MAG: 4Fe-4S dicluster domain-containing protein [Thermoplasmata archaeon]KAA0015163.1 MAG: 4Fe-4S dicluster domain-containing protein [Thermoplasmata archaeon]OYT61731.1 MAG: NADH-quinone oxidoreductase [Thermoplasmatales archaeon ex4484_30]
MLPMLSQLLKQMVKKPFTNIFPAKYAPKNVKKFLQSVQEGRIKVHPPVELPEWFRGKIIYEKEKCIGCRACIKVCPAKAIEFKEEEKKIRIYLGRCIFCSQCNDVCPVQCLHMSQEFLIADDNKLSDNLIVE